MNPPRTSVFFRLTLISAAVASTLAAPAFAQTVAPQAPAAAPAAAPTTQAVDTVLVTGTRSRDRTALNTPVPVDILSAEDLRNAAGSNGELGSALSALLPSFNFQRQSNSGGADHVRSAQLRGMSPDQVLVLINGKRRHTAAVVNLESKVGKGTNPVDFNAIPVSAIKRVEVLRDGAGAQYGSDAVAGVINIILDDARTGGELELSTGTYRTKFDPTGKTITDGQNTQVRGKYGWALGDAGFVRAGAEIGAANPTNRAGRDEIPFFENQTPPNLALQGQRNYRAGEPKVDNAALWLNSAYDWTPDLKVYGFSTLTRRETEGAAFFRYPDSSANVPAIYPNGYLPRTTGTSTDFALTGGVKGASNLAGGEWLWDASLGYGRNSFDYGLANSANPSLGAATPRSFNLGNFTFEQATLNLDASREVNLGLAKPALFATGIELRRDGFSTSAGDAAAYATGPVTSSPAQSQGALALQPGDAIDVRRSVYGVFADLSADVSRELFVQGALRADRYSDFGSAVTGKLAARYAFTPAVALRGAVSSNFRAPSLAQENFSFTVTDFGTGGALASIRTLPANGRIARALGAPELKAEKSNNWSLGLTANPTRALSASLDLYEIRVKDRITLSERFSSAQLTSFIATNFGVAGVQGVNFFTNAVDTKTRGADLVITWTDRVAGGTARVSAASSYAKTELSNFKPVPAQLAALGVSGNLVGLEEQNTLTTAAPLTKHVLTAGWTGAQWGGTLRATRHGKATRVFDFGGGFTPTQQYDAKWQFDLEGEYRVSKQFSVAVGAVNIGDTYPTRSIADISYFGNFPYDVVSPIGFNGAYYYARVRYAF